MRRSLKYWKTRSARRFEVPGGKRGVPGGGFLGGGSQDPRIPGSGSGNSRHTYPEDPKNHPGGPRGVARLLSLFYRAKNAYMSQNARKAEIFLAPQFLDLHSISDLGNRNIFSRCELVHFLSRREFV